MNRLSWIDSAKGLSIILVVLLHVTDEFILKADITYTAEFLYQIERSIGRVAVPIFIMISGFLILKKTSGSHAKKIIIKRIPLFIALALGYSFITNVTYNAIFDNEMSLLSSLKQSFSIKHSHAYQMWFMPVIILLYAMSPLIGFLISKVSTKHITIFMMILSIVVFTPTTLLAVNEGFPISLHIPPIHYIIYFIIGFVLIENSNKISISNILIVIAFISNVIITAAIALFVSRHGNGNPESVSWYTSALTLISSITLLLMLIRLKTSNSNPLAKIGRCSFGIYLFHLIPMFAIIRVCQKYEINLPVSITISLFLILLSCFIFTWLMSKNKYTKYLVM